MAAASLGFDLAVNIRLHLSVSSRYGQARPWPLALASCLFSVQRPALRPSFIRPRSVFRFSFFKMLFVACRLVFPMLLITD
jgi:hypothetical protein